MKKERNIHDLETLEKEIYRLKRHSKNIEQDLDRNFDYLREHYIAMFIKSVFRKRKGKDDERSSFDSILDKVSNNEIISKLIDHIIEKASEGINNILEKLFQKN